MDKEKAETMVKDSQKFTEDDEMDDISESTALYDTLASLCEQYPLEEVLEQLAAVCQDMGYMEAADLLSDAVDFAIDVEEE